jgi:hypothetical protein
MARVLIDLDGDEAKVVHLLRRLLKLLGRAYGIRCKRVEMVARRDGECSLLVRRPRRSDQHEDQRARGRGS